MTKKLADKNVLLTIVVSLAAGDPALKVEKAAKGTKTKKVKETKEKKSPPSTPRPRSFPAARSQ